MTPPIILTGTCIRLAKLKDAGPTVAVRIKMCGSKEEFVTMMVNPLHPQQGGSFNLGRAIKKTGKAIAKGAQAAAPYVSAASDAAIIAGTVTGQPEVVALGAAGKAASKLAGAGKKKKPPIDESESLQAFERHLSDIIHVMGDETTDENQLNDAGLAIFGSEWMGVYASNEIPPSAGYSIQNTRPRTARDVGHWLAHANDLCYDSFGRMEYGDRSGDAEQRRDQNCCGQMCLAWQCVYHDLGPVAARLV